MENWNDDRLDELSRHMDEGFKEMREGFARMDKRFEQVDKRFVRLYYTMITASIGLVVSVILSPTFS